MASPHDIEDLRVMLKALRNEIEAREEAVATDAGNNKLRQRIANAKFQEEVILEKLAESGVKL